MVNIGYLPPRRKPSSVHFDFKKVRLNELLTKERSSSCAARSTSRCSCTSGSGNTSSGWSPRRGPTTPTRLEQAFAVDLVEHGVDLVRRRAPSSAGAVWPKCGRCWCGSGTEVYPEDIQDLAPYVLSHRIWLGPHAASHGLTTDLVINDVIERVPIP
jgi:hypothetical protein